MAAKPSKTHILAWGRMVHLTQRALAAIDQQLAEEGRISLTWYDVLYAVYSSPQQRLRLSDLVEEVILSKSALSRSVEKIIHEGLLKKVACPEDARVAWLEVTPSGKEALRQCWPVYQQGIQEHFSSKLSESEAATLLKLLSKEDSSN